MAKETVCYYEVAEEKNGFVYTHIKGFPTEAEAWTNVAARTSGNWIVNKVEGCYKANGMFKRVNTIRLGGN